MLLSDVRIYAESKAAKLEQTFQLEVLNGRECSSRQKSHSTFKIHFNPRDNLKCPKEGETACLKESKRSAMSEQTWVIQTADLQEGTVLSFDLQDANGNILHKAGMPISDRLKARLAANGITSVTIRGSSEAAPDKVESVLIDSFNPALIEALNQSLDAAHSAIQNVISALASHQEFKADEAVDGVGSFIDNAKKDVSAALAVLITHHSQTGTEFIEQLSERSTKLSLLAVTTALVQGQSEEFAFEVGLAGLMHDCSLILHPGVLARSADGGTSVADMESYKRHPLDSAELLNGAHGFSPKVIEAITQVHEQADGSGFPRGLRLNQMLYHSVILNAADAYLSLTDESANKRFVQSDAMAYMINHAAKGRFCPKTIQAMLRGMSIYPVGTVVLLDDNTKAVVVKSNSESPMQPVVRTLNMSKQRIDLLQSKRTILGPFTDGTTGFARIRKSQINEVFWRTDIQSHSA